MIRNKIPYFSLVLILISSFPVSAEIPFLTSLLGDPATVYQEGTPWSPTNFADQGEALGLESNSFTPAKNLEDAVNFWISIYTQYQSSQGVLHDLENLNVVYEKIDFEFINSNSSLTERQKYKARESLIDERRKQILLGLKKISAEVSENELTDFDKNLRTLWEKQGGIKALKSAAVLERIRFQLGQSDRMKEAIFLSGRYLPMMEQIFKEQGLPLQLTRLVFVESSFNVLARSKVGASGLWQIMPSAARGRLKMNKVIDLRNHPKKATELAAKMLKFNYEMLGNWPLAVTGYNHGPYGVKRLVEKNKTRDLGELIETGEGRRFGFASRNFFASFLAVLNVEGKAAIYFPGIKQSAPFLTEELKLSKSILFKDLVEAFGGDKEMAQLYNPHLQRSAYLNKTTLDSKSFLVVPQNKREEIEKHLEKVVATVLKEEKPSSSKQQKVVAANNKRSEREPADTKKYRVIRGDTLYGISRQFGVSVRSILSLNELKRPRIRAGQILLLPE